MIDQLVALIVNEGKWLSASMGLGPDGRRRFAIPTPPFGSPRPTSSTGSDESVLRGHDRDHGLRTPLSRDHEARIGTLEGSVPVFYVIGIALAAPSWWLIYHTRRVLAPTMITGEQRWFSTPGWRLRSWRLGFTTCPLPHQPSSTSPTTYILAGWWVGRL